jgi:hypothetical protein
MTTLLSSQLLRASTINPSNSAGTMISPRAAPGFLAPRRALRAVSAEGNLVCGKRTCTTLGKGSVPSGNKLAERCLLKVCFSDRNTRLLRKVFYRPGKKIQVNLREP